MVPIIKHHQYVNGTMYNFFIMLCGQAEVSGELELFCRSQFKASNAGRVCLSWLVMLAGGLVWQLKMSLGGQAYYIFIYKA